MALLAVVATALVRKQPATRNAASAPEMAEPLVSLLADTRTDAARAKFDQNQPGEALALLVAALKTDPANQDARELARAILGSTSWNFPETTLQHPLGIDHIAFAAPSSLWVSLSGDTNTTVRWNLESLKTESVLFPVNVPETRSLVFDAGHRFVVVERGGFALLCDAETLKPIRDIGAPPPSVTPSSAIAFSPGSLLVAHPVLSDGPNSPIQWHLRDTATGETLRRSEPAGADDPIPLAAFLDRTALRVFRQDGSIWTMPVSPVSPIETTPPPETGRFLHAMFSNTGDSLLVLQDKGPHTTPALQTIDLGRGTNAPLRPGELLDREPFSLQPSIWNGLLRQCDEPLEVREKTTLFAVGRAPIRSETAITAAAFAGDRSFIAKADGTVTLYRHIPPPASASQPIPPAVADPEAVQALQNLAVALGGESCDDSGRHFSQSSPDRRLEAFQACDFDQLSRMFPTLDFQPVITAMETLAPRSVPADALSVLTDRLARASASPADRAAQSRIEQAFESNDSATVLAAIEAAGAKGTAAAKALELALASTRPEWIDACLKQAADLPPLLQKLAISRIEWLQDRKANAVAVWSMGFPDYHQVRLSEDWDGWEQADFSQALAAFHSWTADELAALTVPENSTAQQRKAVIERLSNPETISIVGKAHFAKSCLDAALALSYFDGEAEATFALAAQARKLGMEPAPCLRAEALALTTLGDYKNARDRWVSLITEQPVETHEPSDYAEAAYTAFENADPRQAMAILTTGIHRFPNDANYALRAGWVALLTGNPEKAYRFLLDGNRIGYPQEKLENATVLLAIAAMQVGAADDAYAFYQDLIRLDPAWEKPETIETLDWPEELKVSLRQLMW